MLSSGANLRPFIPEFRVIDSIFFAKRYCDETDDASAYIKTDCHYKRTAIRTKSIVE